MIDDERPDLVDDLTASRFSVDYSEDITRENIDLIDRPLFDLILLDFGGVGKEFGDDQGLSLLRHIRRVNPATVVIAYTSKALKSQHADFFRLVDGVLSKDAGIAESTEKIEEELRKAHSIANIWKGLLQVAGVTHGSDMDIKLQDTFVRGLSDEESRQDFMTTIKERFSGEAAAVVGPILIEKMIELGIKAATST